MSESERSASTLRFLGGVYLTGLEHPRVTLSELGKRFGISPPAVSRRATRLIRRGYLTRDGACGLLLTEEGRRIALQSIRRQEVCEVFLVKALDYTWDEVFPAAWSMSPYLDDAAIERMYVRAGSPQRCPHGHPIPTAGGRIELIADRPLTTLSDDEAGVVSRVFTHNPDMLRYLAQLHLQPGAAVQVLERAPFNGPIHVRVRTREGEITTAVGVEVAAFVHVERVD